MQHNKINPTWKNTQQKKSNERVQHKKEFFYIGMIKRKEIDKDALDDMEIVSSEDDLSSIVESIQEKGNPNTHDCTEYNSQDDDSATTDSRHNRRKVCLSPNNYIFDACDV